VHDTNAGEGVDIYIVDTGVRISHSDFGGRASWGVSFVGETKDNRGHGTHCAGTAAGSRFGVAKVRPVGFGLLMFSEGTNEGFSNRKPK
jgi:cerevisin